ncbi:MAG: hypothetical protein KME12_06020 [Trichocoleus desertorum ATA4-8-CV12]|jgi:hypothetical protein|nr:hypothetical protein [Trichocoleus desertorum ATA4-8-CV12]
MRIAQRDDWEIQPIPSKLASISVEKFYSQDEFNKLIAGVIPEVMEEKWFVFYESPWLYLYRSWTGDFVFKVRFEVVAGGVAIAEALVNRDPNQYTETDHKQDIAILITSLDSCITRNTRNQILRNH